MVGVSLIIAFSLPAGARIYDRSSIYSMGGGGSLYVEIYTPFTDTQTLIHDRRWTYNAFGRAECFDCGANKMSVQHRYTHSGVQLSASTSGIGFSASGATCTSNVSESPNNFTWVSAFYGYEVCRASAVFTMFSGTGRVIGGARVGAAWTYREAVRTRSWPSY
jgi:hypothetical protein